MLILLFSLLSHAVRQPGHSVQQIFHSGLTFQDLVGTARSLVPLFCLPAGKADTITTPHQYSHERPFFFFSSYFLIVDLLEIQWQTNFLNIHCYIFLKSNHLCFSNVFVPPVRESETFLSTEPLQCDTKLQIAEKSGVLIADPSCFIFYDHDFTTTLTRSPKADSISQQILRKCSSLTF